jgi:DNA-binding response OmpR family regulator
VSAPRPLLLVDDDPSNLLTLSAVLEDEGFEVVTAASLQEARDALQPGRPFSAAIVDRNLAGEDGLALAAELRADAHAHAVFILSGDPAGAEEPAGLDGWLLKGESLDSLIERVRAALPG